MANPRYTIFSARAVFDTRLSHIELRVLAALGTYTDREGWCFPSQKELVEKLGVARSSVCAAIKRLASPDIGYIEVRPRTAKGRGKVGNEYRVSLDLAPMSASDDIGKKPMSTAPDIGTQVIEVAPMSAPQDIGADVHAGGQPMSTAPDIGYKEVTFPLEHSHTLPGLALPNPGAKKSKPRAGAQPRKAKRKRAAYTPEFEAFWRSWPKARRALSDKRVSFERWMRAVEDYSVERLMGAAKYYLALPNVRKDGFKFCRLAEVFLNGGLDAVVEAAEDGATEGEQVWSAERQAWVDA